MQPTSLYPCPPHTGFLDLPGTSEPQTPPGIGISERRGEQIAAAEGSGEMFLHLYSSQGTGAQPVCSSAQQMSTDLMLLGVSGGGGGESVASWSHLTSPRTELLRASSFVIAMGSFPRAHQPACKLLTLSTILAGEMQAQSGRGTQ